MKILQLITFFIFNSFFWMLMVFHFCLIVKMAQIDLLHALFFYDVSLETKIRNYFFPTQNALSLCNTYRGILVANVLYISVHFNELLRSWVYLFV